jgi:PAS domain S-box-containing protein
MINLFSAPDKEKDSQGYMVFVLTLLWTATSGFVDLLNLFLFSENWVRWLSFLGISIFIALVNLLLIQWRRVKLASWSLTLMLWLFIALASYFAGGLSAPRILSQTCVILTAGFLLGWRGGLAIGLLTVGSDLWLAFLEENGQLPPSSIQATPYFRWLNSIIPFGTILVLQYYATRHLQAGLAAMKREIELREQLENEKNDTVRNLRERVKELTTLYLASKTLREEELLPDERFRDIATILPQGFSSPEYTGARIYYGGREFLSERFRPSAWSFSAEAKTTSGTKVGVEVVYLNEPVTPEIDPILSEEKDMVKMLVDTLKDYIERGERKFELEDFRYALDLAAMVSIADADANFNFVNDNFCRVSKYSREELLNSNHMILYSGVHSPEYFEDMAIAMQHGKPFRGEFCNRAKDGSLYWVDSTVVPFLNAEGKVYQWLSINYDITERKIAEEKLVQSEERYKSLIEIANIGAWEYHIDTGQTWCSPQYFSMLGIDRVEGTRDDSLEEMWVSRIHPEDKAEAYGRFKAFVESDTNQLYEAIFRLAHEDGSWVWAWSRARKLQDEKGNLTSVVLGSEIDITERIQAEEKIKESEQQIRKITSQVPAITYMFQIFEDGHTNILFMNKGMDRFGYPFVVEKASQTHEKLTEILYSDDRDKYSNAMKEAYRTQNPISFQYRVVFGDVVRWRWMQAVPEKDKNGNTVWYGATSDVTQLVEYIASIEQMIFDVGHVIRRPISNMLSLTNVIQSGVLNDQEVREISQNLSLIAQEMDKFIRELNDTYQEKRQNTHFKVDITSMLDNRSNLFD